MERMELVEYCTSSAWRLKIKWLELPTCGFIDDTVSHHIAPILLNTQKVHCLIDDFHRDFSAASWRRMALSPPASRH
jgi:hypothetical protein